VEQDYCESDSNKCKQISSEGLLRLLKELKFLKILMEQQGRFEEQEGAALLGSRE